ncbi:MAG TPA: PhoH family protein [Stellaceae bacterium]|jgi:phosphate starvation-inducible PhoH-like protein|nr:PhoH family protein [Stellaceae bacterium]
MRPPGASSAPKPTGDAVQMQFDDNALLPLLFGERDAHLDRIERQLGVSVVSRGNRLAISGPSPRADQARAALAALYDRLKRGLEVDGPTVDAAVRLAHSRPGEAPSPFGVEAEIHTRKRRVSARGANQADYIRALRSHELVFGLGPAGTGKTYLAVATAVDMMMSGKVERIVLSRPAVEAGERLGFLPGDVREKVDPYLRPLYDALYDMLPGEQVQKRLLSGEIEIAPLAFMRGRTLSHAYIILDEAQNTTPVQMKMFLTRLGEGARMAVTGDLSQIDLPRGTTSGVNDALAALEGVEGITIIRFTEADVVRHPLVQRIVQAYDRRDRRRGSRRPPGNHE